MLKQNAEGLMLRLREFELELRGTETIVQCEGRLPSNDVAYYSRSILDPIAPDQCIW